MTESRFRRTLSLRFGVGLFVLVAAIVGVTSAAAVVRVPTRGTVPPEAFKAGGVDLSLAPDFIQALGPTGDVVGYIPKQYLAPPAAGALAGAPLGADGRPTSATVPVYAQDLSTLVGHFVPGKGFVPLGTKADSAPARVVQQAPAP